MILDNDLILIRSQMFEVCFIIYFNALNALLAVTVVIGKSDIVELNCPIL